jgi:hypothetical protein
VLEGNRAKGIRAGKTRFCETNPNLFANCYQSEGCDLIPNCHKPNSFTSKFPLFHYRLRHFKQLRKKDSFSQACPSLAKATQTCPSLSPQGGGWAINPNQPSPAKKQTKCRPMQTKKRNHPLIQVMKERLYGLKPYVSAPLPAYVKSCQPMSSAPSPYPSCNGIGQWRFILSILSTSLRLRVAAVHLTG